MRSSECNYEEGIADLDDPIDRAAEVENVRALLVHVEQVVAEAGDTGTLA